MDQEHSSASKTSVVMSVTTATVVALVMAYSIYGSETARDIWSNIEDAGTQFRELVADWWLALDWARPSQLSVAEVNATITSIFLATLTLYFGHILSAKAELLRHAFEAAEEVRAIRPTRTWHLVGTFPLKRFGRPEFSDRLSRLLGLAMGVPQDGIGHGDDASRGFDMLNNMNWLVSHSPVRLSTTPEKPAFVNEEALRQWLGEAESVVETVSAMNDEIRQRAAGYAVAATEAIDEMTKPPVPLARPPGFDEPTRPREEVSATFTEFFQIMYEFAEVVRRSRAALRRYDSYNDRVIRRWQMVTIIAIAVLVLFLGAVLPMLVEDLPRTVYLWVPTVFYLFSGVLGIWALWFVARHRRR